MAVVTWHGDRAQAEIRGDLDEALTALALQIEAQAKVNVTDNGQVDTGFLRTSGYTVAPNANTFVDVADGGLYTSQKTGEQVQRDRAPGPADAPQGGAVVGFAAEYAIYQEEINSYLFRAVEMVAGRDAENVIRQVTR